MRRYFFAIIIAVQLGGPASSYADSRDRLESLLAQLDIAAVPAEAAAARPATPALALTNTGDAADTLFCLTFDKRDTKRTLRMSKSHAYVCFNFLQNPSEAVGNVLNRRGRQRCLITGFFQQGRTIDEDCLVLAFCTDVYVAGACFLPSP
jgi:hypothetical protein